MPLYPSYGLEGDCRFVASHFFDLVQRATLSESGPIRACSYIQDNPRVTYSGTLKTPIPGTPALLIDSGMSL